MKKTISIIIPCLNAEKTILKTINAIKASIKYSNLVSDWEIIAVNDGSSDKTKTILSKIADVSLVDHKINKSLSCARNTGLENSKGNYVAFIDADIEVSKRWLHEMFLILTNSPSAVGVTGTLRPHPKQKLTPLNKYLFSRYRAGQKTNKDSSLSYRAFVFSNTLIKKSVLMDVGFFDENLKHYGGEDTELAIRIHRLYPYGMRKSPSVSFHLTNKKLKKHLLNIYDYGHFNFPQIIKKHPDYKNSLGYFLINPIFSFFIFNRLIESLALILYKVLKHPLLIKLLVVNSFVKGARRGLNR